MNCGTTHHEGCPCHESRRNAEIERAKGRLDTQVRALEAQVRDCGREVERLREQVAINGERYEAWRRRWDEMREIAAETKAEVDRLRDGIREHREATVKAMSHDWELWALLEENHDDR